MFFLVGHITFFLGSLSFARLSVVFQTMTMNPFPRNHLQVYRLRSKPPLTFKVAKSTVLSFDWLYLSLAQDPDPNFFSRFLVNSVVTFRGLWVQMPSPPPLFLIFFALLHYPVASYSYPTFPWRSPLPFFAVLWGFFFCLPALFVTPPSCLGRECFKES